MQYYKVKRKGKNGYAMTAQVEKEKKELDKKKKIKERR